MREVIHVSAIRLLEAARMATAGAALDDSITTWAQLRDRLDETTATMTNWKARGVSMPGAVKAEQEFGTSAVWILTGRHPPGWGPGGSPFSRELLDALKGIDEDQMRRLENQIRAAPDMAPLSSLGNEVSA